MKTKTKLKLGLAGLVAISAPVAWYEWLRPAYYQAQYNYLAPELEAVQEDNRKEGGWSLGRFKVTTYNTANGKHYDKWSTTCERINAKKACRLQNKGFYEAVRCEGSGIGKDGLLYTAASVKPTKEESKGKKPKPGCLLGYTADGNCVKTGRSIAVDRDLIPKGTLVRIEFINKKGNPCETDLCKNFNGWYEASDLGDGIKGKKIDVYGGLEIGRDSYLGKGLPEQANAYIGKLPQGTKLEDVLRNRSPRISKNNHNYQPKKVPIRRDARGH